MSSVFDDCVSFQSTPYSISRIHILRRSYVRQLALRHRTLPATLKMSPYIFQTFSGEENGSSGTFMREKKGPVIFMVSRCRKSWVKRLHSLADSFRHRLSAVQLYWAIPLYSLLTVLDGYELSEWDVIFFCSPHQRPFLTGLILGKDNRYPKLTTLYYANRHDGK